MLDPTLNYVLLVQGYYASTNSWGFPKGKVKIYFFFSQKIFLKKIRLTKENYQLSAQFVKLLKKLDSILKGIF